ncbi:uncharacterized protein PHALS_01970 [Plasmopara halstedii]|uniref:Uncharacterized protein n=1 Tax=Plasmopara halstedii TaxID=4781 RepID=A0A0P1AW54_PLAHL|nr:uncharacterized protein PHALS_01970 [Plasmopara halstedii]CEG45689.1 hypothetical protein PHALS_01970 [Plasmopara halstedii]|eukprot:XP_024582058.1 hypothetical protein PHALS_01970 [Plasmopara halstedii]
MTSWCRSAANDLVVCLHDVEVKVAPVEPGRNICGGKTKMTPKAKMILSWEL